MQCFQFYTYFIIVTSSYAYFSHQKKSFGHYILSPSLQHPCETETTEIPDYILKKQGELFNYQEQAGISIYFLKLQSHVVFISLYPVVSVLRTLTTDGRRDLYLLKISLIPSACGSRCHP